MKLAEFGYMCVSIELHLDGQKYVCVLFVCVCASEASVQLFFLVVSDDYAGLCFSGMKAKGPTMLAQQRNFLSLFC